MASTTSTPSGFLASPRAQQRLLWFSAAVLIAGVAVFLAIFLSRGSSQSQASPQSTVSSGPSSTKGLSTKAPKGQVKASAQALSTARTFLETAVVRKNLAAAYDLVGPYLKGGITRAQWQKGNIPVTFYPAVDASTAQFFINVSQPKYLLLEVLLKAKKSAHLKPQAFKIGMSPAHGKWIVTAFSPESSFRRQASPYN